MFFGNIYVVNFTVCLEGRWRSNRKITHPQIFFVWTKEVSFFKNHPSVLGYRSHCTRRIESSMFMIQMGFFSSQLYVIESSMLIMHTCYYHDNWKIDRFIKETYGPNVFIKRRWVWASAKGLQNELPYVFKYWL